MKITETKKNLDINDQDAFDQYTIIQDANTLAYLGLTSTDRSASAK